jgi:hypothetical protein
MKFGESTIGVGMGVGVVAATYAIGIATQHGYPPLQRLLLPVSGALGFVCAMCAGLDLQERCERYERLLRKNGIDPASPDTGSQP